MGSANALARLFCKVPPKQEGKALPERQQKLRAFHQKMQQSDFDRNVMFRQIGENPEQRSEIIAAFSARNDADDIQRINEEMKREGEEIRAIHAQHKDNPEKLISEFQRYVETHPNSELAYSYLGGALKSAKRWKESIAAYREAEWLAGSETMSGLMDRSYIGKIFEEMGDFSAAAAQYQGIIADAQRASRRKAEFPYPLSELAYLYLGNVLNAQGKRRQARAMWKRIVLSSTAGTEARKMLEENP